MNIKRHIAVAAAASVAAIASAGMSSPAMADRSTPSVKPANNNTTITSAPKPNILTWRECWSGHYAMFREDGFSVNASAAGADLACGSSEDKF